MKNFLLILFLVLNSCGQNCNDLPNSYKNPEEAKTIVLSANFKYTDDCDVSSSSFITSANYYSCNESTGFLIVAMNNKKYIFQNVPFKIWVNFKKADSKSKYYNDEIRGRYKLKSIN